MKICSNCIQPDTRPGIYFDDKGMCGACLWNEEKKKIDWNVRLQELQEIAMWAKKNSDGNYDCAIGVSGGKDSTKQAVTSRDELGLKCLFVNSEPENITDIGKSNIENLKNLGFDVITIRPNPKIMKQLIRYDFFEQLNPIKVTEFSLYASTYIIAEKFRIPLIIQGENPGLTLGTSLTGVGKDANALNAEQLQTLSDGWQRYLQVKGISDDVNVLMNLYRKMLKNRIKPYALYQCDPIKGSSHFRTTIQEGLDLIEQLRGRISGYGIPHYIVDPPEGGGKIALTPDAVIKKTPKGYWLKNWQGKKAFYPEEETVV